MPYPKLDKESSVITLNPLREQPYLVVRHGRDVHAWSLRQGEHLAWEQIFRQSGWSADMPLEYATVSAGTSGGAIEKATNWTPLRARPRGSMAPYRNPPASKSRPPSVAMDRLEDFDQSAFDRYLYDGEVRQIVRGTITELERDARHVLDDYIKTGGKTDWVWLEETLSMHLNDDGLDDVNAYYAAFYLATDFLQKRYPGVKGPYWFWQTNPTQNPAFSTKSLTAEYAAWNRANGLRLGSADEHLHDEELTDAQRAYLQDFVARWDAANDVEERGAGREHHDFTLNPYGARRILADDRVVVVATGELGTVIASAPNFAMVRLDSGRTAKMTGEEIHPIDDAVDRLSKKYHRAAEDEKALGEKWARMGILGNPDEDQRGGAHRSHEHVWDDEKTFCRICGDKSQGRHIPENAAKWGGCSNCGGDVLIGEVCEGCGELVRNPAGKDSDVFNMFDIADMLGLPDYDKVEEMNQDYIADEALNAHIQDDETQEEASAHAEHEAQKELHRKWYRAVEKAAEELLGQHGLTIVPKKFPGRNQPRLPHQVVIVPEKSWEDAASKIVDTINGVGMFHFSSLREFLKSGPYTARQAVLRHLGYVKRRPDVYGTQTAKSIYDGMWRW